MPLKRLMSKLRAEPPPGDLATDDWSPVPVDATAQRADTLDWLLEDDGQALPLHPVLSDAPVIPPEPAPQKPSYLQFFSPEELAVIAEQQRTAQAEQPAETQEVAAPQPEQPAETQEVAAPRPRKRHSTWINVLRTCGEYLSEAELKIIRQQLAST